MSVTSDYLIVGGGLAGCVVASRLKERHPHLSVTIIEAGTDEHANPIITEPMGVFQLYQSKYTYSYMTTPQKHLDGRRIFNMGGKMLSGSTCCNYGTWMRGDAEDYNAWADVVNDQRWSYEGQLPFFKKIETHFDSAADPDSHGSSGPIHNARVDRTYPLKEPLRNAYESFGLRANGDGNAGDLDGYVPHVENWKGGKRQPAGAAYPLDGVEVLTASPVKNILLESGHGELVAKGVELVNGKQLMASKEVILACGAYRSPQVLMLSGIGPAHELEKHNIKVVLNQPEVGKNFFDHSMICQFYKVRHPEQGLCVGAQEFHIRDPSYAEGLPMNWFVWEHLPAEQLKEALLKDNENEGHSLVSKQRKSIGQVVMYSPLEPHMTDLKLPLDGSIFTTASLIVLPTSRGSITLASADPNDDPHIDPNYFATNVDKLLCRTAMRKTMAVMETPEMTEIIACEVTPEGYPALTSKATDEELNARIRRMSCAWYHGAGSCAMGKVVDTDLKVKGVRGLRVVDASVYPVPLAAALQCPTYALAEQAAVIIGQGITK